MISLKPRPSVPLAVTLYRVVVLPAALLLTVAATLLFNHAEAQTNSNSNGNIVSANVAVITNNNGSTGERIEEKRAISIVRGRVVYDDSRQPVRRARVSLLDADAAKRGGRGNARELNSVTNMRGEFTFRGVRAGRYFVAVDAPGIISPAAFTSFERDEVDLDEAAQLFDEVTVAAGQEAQVEVHARRGGAITGRIAYTDGAPAVNVQVQLLRKANGKLRLMIANVSSFLTSMRTDDRGVYRIGSLPAGEYYIGVAEMNTSDAGGRGGDYDGLYSASDALAATYYPDATSAKGAAPVVVAAGEERTDINITLPERRVNVVEGIVLRRPGGEPLAGATVGLAGTGESAVLSFAGTGGQTTATDEGGHWSFREVPEGTYKLSVTPPYDYSGAESGSMNGNMNVANMNVGNMNAANVPRVRKPRLAPKTQEVKVEGSDIEGMTIELSEGGRIAGRVSIEGAAATRPVGVVTIMIHNADDASTQFGYSPNGKFEVEAIPAGQIYIDAKKQTVYGESGAEAEHGEVGVEASDKRYYVKSVMVNNTDVTRTGLRVEEGKEISNVRIVLSPDVATLKGRLVAADDANKAIPRVAVALIPADPKLWRNRILYLYAMSDADGRFEVGGAAPGEYLVVRLDAEAGDAESALSDSFINKQSADTPRVTLRAKETRTQDLPLPVPIAAK